MNLKEVSQQSMAIRNRYHQFEKELHGSVWSVEEDALAFLHDDGWIGRSTIKDVSPVWIQLYCLQK